MGPKGSFRCVQFLDKNLHQVLCLLVTVVLGDDDYQDYNSDDVASEQLDGQEAEEHPLSHSHLHFGPHSSLQPLPSLQPALPAGPLVGSTRLGVVDHGPAVRVGHHGGVGHRHAAAGHGLADAAAVDAAGTLRVTDHARVLMASPRERQHS